MQSLGVRVKLLSSWGKVANEAQNSLEQHLSLLVEAIKLNVKTPVTSRRAKVETCIGRWVGELSQAAVEGLGVQVRHDQALGVIRTNGRREEVKSPAGLGHVKRVIRLEHQGAQLVVFQNPRDLLAFNCQGKSCKVKQL